MSRSRIAAHLSVVALVVASLAGTLLAQIASRASAASLVTNIPVSGPRGVAANPNTNKIYVASLGTNTVKIIDGSSNAVTSIGGFSNPRGVAVNSATNRIYVTNYGSGLLYGINGNTNGIEMGVGIAPGIGPVAVNPSLNRVYVGRDGAAVLYVVNPTTSSFGVIPLPAPAIDVAVNPNTNRIYVTTIGCAVAIIDGTTNSVIGAPCVSGPNGVAVNPNTNTFYVTHPFNQAVSVWNGASNTQITQIVTGINPRMVAVNPTTNRIYVSVAQNGEVKIFNGATNALIQSVGVGNTPEWITTNPATNRVYTSVSGANYGAVAVVDDTPIPVPAISGFTPDSGPEGTTVTLSGTGFMAPAAVTFDGVPAAVTVASSTTIITAVPPGGRTGKISVSTPGGYAKSATDFVVTAPDTVPPVLTLPSSLTAPAVGPSGAVVTFTATATDNVNGPVPVTCTPPSGSVFPVGTTTVSCTASDMAGNTSTGSFSVTVVDTVPPTLTLPANMTIEATGPAGAPATFNVSATDLVGGPRPVTCAPSLGSGFPIGTTTVNCSSSDAAGNTSTGSFSVTVVDTTPPFLALPANIIAEATGAAGAAVTFSSSATDLVDGAVAVTCTPASGSTFAIGTTTVTCSSSDSRGNTGSASFSVTVTDTTPPVLTLPANITAEATGPAGAAVTFTAAASDIVDGSVMTTCTPSSGSTFAIGITTATCSSSDTRGNTGTGSFTVTVVDTTPPTLTVPINISAEATGPAGTAVTFTASASDLVDGARTVTCTPASGSTFAIGPTMVSCTSSDTRGNTGSAGLTVTVQDMTPPVVVVPGSISTEATGPAGAAVTFATSASDSTDGAAVVTCTPASGSTFAIGTTVVTCSATDAHGNTGSASVSVTVSDTTPPAVTVPDTITAEATGAAGATVTFIASASDLVDGARAVTCTPASGSTFAIGVTSVSCASSDTRGNTGTATFSVSVADTTPPAVAVPANITAEANGPAGTAVTFTVSASDTVDGALPVACTPAAGSSFLLGTTVVTCSATDAHGNTGSASFTVTVVDTTPPVLTLPANITVEATGPAGASVTFTASASDIADGAIAVTCTPSAGSTFAIGTTAVTCSATDSHGNTAAGSFTVTVVDTIAPVITYSGNAGTYTLDQMVNITCSATDGASGVASSTCANISGPAYTFASGSNTFSASATDAAGNVGTGSVTFTVQVTGAGMRTLIQQFVTKPGVVNALIVKVDAIEAAAARNNASAKAGALTSFKNDVAAQVGKTLTAEQAAILVRLADSL